MNVWSLPVIRLAQEVKNNERDSAFKKSNNCGGGGMRLFNVAHSARYSANEGFSTEPNPLAWGVLLLLSDALRLCPFGVGAYI